ncbi:MFS family permease [Streptomyces sp. SAI-195]
MSSPATAPPAPNNLKRIVAASLIGTTIEWYDFFLYGSAAALVFNELFFPDSDPLVGTLLSFLTYAVGFAARPVGALVFGHYGDRLGRKKLLVLSLLMMGGATFAIGLLPTHATIGTAAPVLLTVLRLVQGFALGGEWGGAVLLVSEHGDARRRGFWASWPQTGAPAGQLLATGVLSLLTAVLSDDAFNSWGWRIPFLLSGVLVMVGLWIRLSVDESPVFKQALAQAESRKAKDEPLPLVAVVRYHWRDVLIAMGARMAENISYYVITAFILVYATTAADVSKQTALNAVLIASAVHFAVIPAWGALSDRIGRRPVYLLGAAGCRAVDVPVLHADRLRPIRQSAARGDRGAGAARRHVRAPGGLLLRDVRHPDALFGGVDRRPVRLRGGGGTGTADRHRAAVRVRQLDADLPLCHRLGRADAVRRGSGPGDPAPGPRGGRRGPRRRRRGRAGVRLPCAAGAHRLSRSATGPRTPVRAGVSAVSGPTTGGV